MRRDFICVLIILLSIWIETECKDFDSSDQFENEEIDSLRKPRKTRYDGKWKPIEDYTYDEGGHHEENSYGMRTEYTMVSQPDKYTHLFQPIDSHILDPFEDGLKHFRKHKFTGHSFKSYNPKDNPLILQSFNSHRFSPNKLFGFTPANSLDGIAHPDHNVYPQLAPHKKFCSSHETCKPVVQCAPFYYFLHQQSDSVCALRTGGAGVCCPYISMPDGYVALLPPPEINVYIRDFSFNEINDACKEGLYTERGRDAFNTVLQTNNISLTNRNINRPDFHHLQFFRTSETAKGIGKGANQIVLANAALVRRFDLTTQQSGFGLSKFNVQNTLIDKVCVPQEECNIKDKYYRRSNATCNNFRNPNLGSARTTFIRITPPTYQNGFESPRTLSVTGKELPSPREISATNVRDVDRPDPHLTRLHMQWGQWIDHDITHAPLQRFANNDGIQCCSEDGQFIDSKLLHAACFPIEIPLKDPFYSQFNQRCMNFVRSQIAPKENCTLGYKEQMNQVTHFIDGSPIYGSSEDQENDVRAFRNGLLRTNGNDLMPVNDGEDSPFCGVGANMPDTAGCFIAGDNRVNQQPDVISFHAIFLREHNRIARKLLHLNPHWSDETTYQETRRIVVAQHQHIIYNEYLPPVIGTEFALKTGILPQRKGFTFNYDSNIDARIISEFATAAFRFGHSTVQGMMQTNGKKHQNTGVALLHENFNMPGMMFRRGRVEEFLRGGAKQPMQSFDTFFTDSVQNRLFQTPEMPFGLDLVSINIQRGRDHAIGTYNDLREACGLPRARKFSDFRDLLHPGIVESFKKLYAHPDDVDAFIAGVAERPVDGAIVGPTFRCIIADQFQRLKRGDRFFYEQGGMKTSFTEAQLNEIRKTSWSRLICDNGIHIKKMQPLSMRLPGPLNMKTYCNSDEIPRIDLTPWISDKPY